MILSVVLAEIVVSEVAVRPDRLIVTDVTARVAMTVTDVIDVIARAAKMASVVRRDRLIVIDVIARAAITV
ncbi:MAG: hypothetical protein ACKO6O_02835, partial [Acidimicrobiaceae bacterium]